MFIDNPQVIFELLFSLKGSSYLLSVSVCECVCVCVCERERERDRERGR